LVFITIKNIEIIYLGLDLHGSIRIHSQRLHNPHGSATIPIGVMGATHGLIGGIIPQQPGCCGDNRIRIGSDQLDRLVRDPPKLIRGKR